MKARLFFGPFGVEGVERDVDACRLLVVEEVARYDTEVEFKPCGRAWRSTVVEFAVFEKRPGGRFECIFWNREAVAAIVAERASGSLDCGTCKARLPHV